MQKKKLYGKSRFVPVIKKEEDLISWIKRGKVRLIVFRNITANTLPSELVIFLAKDKRKSSSYYTQVSRSLAELELCGLVSCSNPKEKIGRLYNITKSGISIKKKLKL